MRYILVMFLLYSTMLLSDPNLPCLPNPCEVWNHERCVAVDGEASCICEDNYERVAGECQILGDNWDQLTPSLSPGVFNGDLDERYNNDYEPGCLRSILNPNMILNSGKDRMYELYISNPTKVTIDVVTSEFDSVLSIVKADTKEVIYCNNNRSILDHRALLANRDLNSGYYYLIIDSVGEDSGGTYQLDVLFEDTCENVDCDNSGVCELIDGYAQCQCSGGYENPSTWDGNYRCVSVCDGIQCPLKSSCTFDPDTNEPFCDCDEGYYMNESETVCIDYCTDVDCGNGICDNSNDTAVCVCDEGYEIHPETGSCEWKEYWGGSLDKNMGDTSYTSLFRNLRFKYWKNKMMNYFNFLKNNMLYFREEHLMIYDPHQHLTQRELIEFFFNSTIWYNVSHGSSYSDIPRERYLSFGKGENKLRITLNEIYSYSYNEKHNLVWFTTTACHSGDNEVLNGRDTLWNYNIRNLLTSNYKANPNGYFGTDGVFTNGPTTNEQGEDFAWSYSYDGSHMKYAWKWSYEDWWIQNDPVIVYAGGTKDDALSRMKKDYYIPDNNRSKHRQKRLKKTEIKSYAIKKYVNDGFNWGILEF